MQLLVAVVQSEDAPILSKHLVEHDLRLTQINSSGGLFGSGNVVLLLGVDDARYGDVIHAIELTCKTRIKHVNAAAMPEPFYFSFMPLEVEVGGAVVFGMPVERFVPILGTSEAAPAVAGGASTPAGDQPFASPAAGPTHGGGEQMKLMVAIVQGEDADDVIRALLAAGHRLTRINTTGGFLRRGNATLLIGVEAQQVDEVIHLIQSACRRRTESAPIEKGLPEYAANVFVLDAPHFIRV
jgi:uncharacterized protein YaaQ